MSRPRLKMFLIAGALLLLAASLTAPFISADRYRGPILAALERGLGRKVEISTVRLRLWPQPGFTVSDVTIGEDPAIGIEPMAYVTTLRAVPRILALLRGRLEFASVDLEDASLNLTRVDRGQTGVHWNFPAFSHAEPFAAFPSVHMRGGRVNFKFNETKSLFYLLDTDVDFWPPGSPDGAWTVRLRAEPARTDRPARGFGSFLARGQWLPGNSSTTLDVSLEPSQLGDILTLFNGQESGIQGQISGDAHLAGPAGKLGLSGRMNIANLHGWSQTPPGGNAWPLALGGVVDLPGQTIDIDARMFGAQPPFALRYRVADYLRRPRWGVTANLSRFPLSPLVGIARNLGWEIPPDFKLDGTADGAVSYSIPEGAARMDGQLSLANSTLAVAGTPPLRIASADLRFAAATVTLRPAEILNDRNEAATLEGEWDMNNQTLQAALSSGGMQIASLRRQISIAGIPLLSQATAGLWRGNLRYRSEPAGWTGEFHLDNTIVPFEAFAEPLQIVSADAAIAADGLSLKRLKVSLGGLDGQGEYNYRPSESRPHRFNVTLAEASGAAMEKVLMPALRRGNFFTYAFNFGRVPEPGWLRNIRADGIIQTASLDLGGTAFTNVKSHVLWDGTEVRLATLQTEFGTAAFAGDALIHLGRRQPAYEIAGKVTGMPWRSGTLDAVGTLSSSGTGTDLLDHLRANGLFEGREIDLTPLDSFDSVAGAFDWAWDARNPKLHLTQLLLKSGPDIFQGSAETQDNGQVLLKITDGMRHIQAAGAILRGDALKVTP